MRLKQPGSPEFVKAYMHAPAHLRHSGLFIRHYIQGRVAMFATLFAAVVLAATCAVLMQYQIKRLVDAMSASGGSVHSAWFALLLFVTLMAAESTLLRSCAWLTCRATLAVGVEMRLELFNYLSGQSMGYFADNLAGSLGQRITGTAGNFGALANTTVWRIIPPIVDFAGALVIFSLTDWRITVVLATYVAAATAALIIAGKKGKHLHTDYFARASGVGGRLIDVIANMWAVKAFSAREREYQRLRQEFAGEATAQHRSWMYTEKIRICYDIAVWLMAAGIAGWAVYSWSLHSISPGSVVVLIALTFRILHGSRDVALALVDVGHQVGYIEDTLHVIGQVHAVLDPPDARRLAHTRGAIRFQNVSFGYDPARPVLRDVSFSIEAGEKVGIVGASGAGKTTILQLLQRLHEVQTGEITIDGVPLHRVDQDSLRSLISVVPQEISLFHRSIAENIRFARPDATEADVMDAARASRCDEFVARWPDAYDTVVGERGVKLSGGQRQRVGIARALLKDARILLLDEATSALDSALELQIQRSIYNLRGRTVIAIAHRLATLACYDRILVIAGGQIAEQGAPDELRRNGRLFRSLWRMQTAGLSLV